MEAVSLRADSDAESLMPPENRPLRAKSHGVAFVLGIVAISTLALASSPLRSAGSAKADLDNLESKASRSVDLLTITGIQCVKPAGGLDAAGQSAFATVGAVIAGGATAVVGGTTVVLTGVATGGAAATVTVPVTYGAIVGAASSGAGAAVTASKFLDGHFSGRDNLVVHVNGEKAWPRNAKYRDVNAGETVSDKIQISFQGHARISLIEYDWGSDNDDLGQLDVIGGSTRSVDRAVITAPRPEDGSVYYVTYRVDKGKGNLHDVVGWILCGTNQCDACENQGCRGHDYRNLDRDKDYGDLKGCPHGFHSRWFQRYPQWWPAADVFLRVCERH